MGTVFPSSYELEGRVSVWPRMLLRAAQLAVVRDFPARHVSECATRFLGSLPLPRLPASPSYDADVGVGVVHSTSSTFAEPLSRSLERPLLGTAAVSLCRRLGGSALVDEAPRLRAVSCAQISHHCVHMSAMKNVEPSAFCVDVPSRHAYVVHYAQ